MDRDTFKKEIRSKCTQLRHLQKNIEKLKKQYEKELPIRVGDVCTLIANTSRDNGRKIKIERIIFYDDGIQIGKWRPIFYRTFTKKGELSKRLNYIFDSEGVEKNGIKYIGWQS